MPTCRILPALLVAALTAGVGCSDDGKKGGEKSVLALSDARTAIAERTKKVADYRYRGTATTLDGGEKAEFTYQLKQPGMLRADIEGIDQSYVFDGQNLVVIDRKGKRVVKRDLKKMGDLAVVTTLHQFFGDYACEGWKPPLLRTKKGLNAGAVEKEDQGLVWVLTTPVDDKDLKEVRYTLRAPTADFLKKEWIAKDGSLWASTAVLEEHKDERTGLSFPKTWEHKGPQRKYRVELRDIEINKGLPGEPFVAKAPEGFSIQEVGG